MVSNVKFKEYMHVERFGTSEVEGIEHGTCFIFPKIDGTNASVWLDDGEIRAGSRTRTLTVDHDNAGFYAWVLQQQGLKDYLLAHPTHRLYGEWLVPHTLKTYRKDAWRRFWIFDVAVKVGDEEMYMSYDDYNAELAKYGLDYVVPMFRIENVHLEYLTESLKKNTFLIEDNAGIGEGVVVKNYEFTNRYGRTVWAKVVRQEFKEENTKTFGVNTISLGDGIEKKIVDKFVTEAMIEKVMAKIINEVGVWETKCIPRLLNTVYYDLIKEETWEFLKEFNLPTINFQSLKAFTIKKVKSIKKELF